MDPLATITKPAVETPMFFDNGPYRLFGVLHEPAEPTAAFGWVFCHPFAEEKLWTHRACVSFARTLASRGHWVLRFDAMGNGDSDGQFSEVSMESMLADIACAVRTLEQLSRIGRGVGLLGMRLGGAAAALAAEKLPSVNKLVLWEPIVDGAKYMQEMLRINLTTQTAVYKEIRHKREDLVRIMQNGATVNIDGYQLGYPCYEQVSAVKLDAAARSFRGRCLIVQLGREGQPFRADLTALQQRYPYADLKLAVEEPFWKEIKQWYGTAPNLTAATLSWLGHS